MASIATGFRGLSGFVSRGRMTETGWLVRFDCVRTRYSPSGNTNVTPTPAPSAAQGGVASIQALGGGQWKR